jgi:catechol 2,3-dioxygenase-like lactoylglutathione lyase family enzyme
MREHTVNTARREARSTVSIVDERGAMAATIGFNHVATVTSDMDRLVGFYKQVFGAEVTFEMAAKPDHPRMSILDLGAGAALNVFEVEPDTILGDRRRQGGRGPIDHFALAVDSRAKLEEVRDRLVEAGADIGEIQRLGNEWSLFFRDPDGMELEVCCHAD